MARGMAVAVAFAFLLAGCAADPKESELPPPTASKSDTTGGIEGRITTDEIQPIKGAQVAIQGVNTTVATDEGGAFAFSNLDPGSYTLLAAALGYFSATKPIEVVAGEVASANIILDRIPIAAPNFTETLEFGTLLLVNQADTCPSPDEPTRGLSWEEFPIPINGSKPDGTRLAATNLLIELKSDESSATVDVDMYLFPPTGDDSIAQGTEFAPNERAEVDDYLPPGEYRLHVCLYLGTNANIEVKVMVTYEQGEAADYVIKNGKKK